MVAGRHAAQHTTPLPDRQRWGLQHDDRRARPLRRIAVSEEIARAVGWLASPEASYVTARCSPSSAATWRADTAG
ncbi:MAG TPA: hypothetical protein VF003_18745 [Pseudonocardiaceae bacterium]